MTAFFERAGLLYDNENRIGSIRYDASLTVTMVFLLLLTPAVGWPESIQPDRGEFLKSFEKMSLHGT